MHVGAAACNKGEVAGPSVCVDMVDAVGTIWTAPVRALALGSCTLRICFRAARDVKIAHVLCSYSRQKDEAQRDPTGQQPPPRDKGHTKVSRGHTAAADPTECEQWKEFGQQKTRDRSLRLR